MFTSRRNFCILFLIPINFSIIERGLCTAEYRDHNQLLHGRFLKPIISTLIQVRIVYCIPVSSTQNSVTVMAKVHAYERSNRVYNYKLDPCGPVHITIGHGGNRKSLAIPFADEPGQCPNPSTTLGDCSSNFTSGPAAGKFCWDRQPDFSTYRESSFGHEILEVKNNTHGPWMWHRNQDTYNEVGDQIFNAKAAGEVSF